MKLLTTFLILTTLISCGKHSNSKKKNPIMGVTPLSQAQIDRACKGTQPRSLEGRWSTNLLDDIVDYSVFLEFRDNGDMYTGIECMVQDGPRDFTFYSTSEFADYTVSGNDIDIFMQGDVVATDDNGEAVCSLADISGKHKWGFQGKCLYLKVSNKQTHFFIKQNI